MKLKRHATLRTSIVVAAGFVFGTFFIGSAHDGSAILGDPKPTPIPIPTEMPATSDFGIRSFSITQAAPTDRGIDPDTLIVNLYDASDLREPVRTLRWTTPLDFFFDCFGEAEPFEGCELVEDLTEGGNWSVKWQGSLLVPADGEYTFSLPGHDDGVQVLIDGELITDSGWRYPSPDLRHDPQTVTLSEGFHDIVVDYEQRVPFIAELEVRWDGPGFNDEVLPLLRKTGPSIDSVEISQATQIYQPLFDLQADLSDNGEPPVPIVAFKPTVLRVFLSEFSATTRVEVRLDFEPGGLRIQHLPIPPNCAPTEQRERVNGCDSVNFYFGAQHDDWTGVLILLDDDGNELDRVELNVSSRSQDPIKHVPVTVCYIDRDANYECEDGREILKHFDFLRSVAPTHGVYGVGETRKTIVIEPLPLPGFLGDWWVILVRQLNELWLWDSILAGEFLTDRYYFGAVPEGAPGEWGGMAGLRGGSARIYPNNLPFTRYTIAHETGHLLGRRHPDLVEPGECSDPGPFFDDDHWPYNDLYIQELGFDVANQKVILPEDAYDLMSYCPLPRWVTPYTYGSEVYKGMLEPLSDLSSSEPLEEPTAALWHVSGAIDIEAQQAMIAPVFELQGSYPPGDVSGEYSLNVVDGAGSTLFSHPFSLGFISPQADTNPPGPSIEVFSQAIPAVDGAAAILLINRVGEEIGSMVLGGIEPEVVIDSPTGGGELTGEQIILWTITDGDSQEHMARVLYSPDGGESQHVLGWGTPLSRMVVNFDDLPGCQMNCQVQVLVSDGANTGSAILTGFTVPSKTPTAEIVFPDTDQAFKVGEMVWLQGVGWDPEDGVVSGASMTWSSDIDGLLGTGVDLPIADLGEGLHTISLTVNDTDGNSATDAITVHIDGTAPVLSLFVRRDEVPSRCVDAKIGAFDESGGSGLAKVEYSLDGGESWMEIPLANLPFEFTVPGSGYIHLVSHAIDTAGNFSYEDLPFTISEPCAPQNRTPVADAGGPYSVDEGGSVRLDGSTSNDPDGNIVLYEWDLDADNEYDDAQGETGDIAFGDNGTFTVALLVTDNQGETDTDSAEVIVSNLMPEVALDTSYAILIKDQEVFIGRAGETQGHRAESIDPGSDDLTFTWSFGPTMTYFSNGVSPDPFPSPDGEFPFYAEDYAQTTFEKPGVYEIGVVVEDDDGDSAEVSVIKLIAGQFLCPQSQGFWKHQVSAKGKPHVDESTLLSYLEMIAWTSSYFGDKESLESLDDARDVMEIKGPGMRSKAEAQLLPAWLNFTSGSIGWEEIIDTDAGGELDTPFYEIVQRVEMILLLEQPTHDELVKAKDLAKAVNKSSKGQNACDE